ncbi:MAG TPA: hypothetical protein VH081_12175 [Solirubrobacteraceae bacterium]|jgi:hypothetical protein|nr:hypothetical protein [Solirubrobacteraceae bacterium]
MYHYELRKFPHTFCVFNQSEQQLRAIVGPWTSGEWVEVGERTWNIHETKLTILDGPELTLPDLAMNRGWRNARRRSEDVTERVLGATKVRGVRGGVAGPAVEDLARHGVAHAAVPTGDGPAAGSGADGALELLADSLGLEILGLLDAEAVAASRVWRLAQARLPERGAAESLSLAERAIRSLLARRLGVLRRGGEPVDEEQVETALRAVESWSDGEQGALAIARKA